MDTVATIVATIAVSVVGSVVSSFVVPPIKRARLWVWGHLRGVIGLKRPATAGWHQVAADQLRSETRVLIVDDDTDEKLPHFPQLKARGFTVTQWHAIRATNVKSIEADFDLVVLDNRGVRDDLGSDSGVDALEIVRRDNPWIPVVINTSYPEDISRSRRDKLRQHNAEVVSKVMRYSEFEEVLLDAASRSRTLDYFCDRLSRLGAEDAAALLDEHLDPATDARLPAQLSAIQRQQVLNLLARAAEIYRHQRWKQR